MKAKSTSLLDIEKIVKASEGSKLSSKFITENTPTLERLSKKLGVSKTQATLLFSALGHPTFSFSSGM